MTYTIAAAIETNTRIIRQANGLRYVEMADERLDSINIRVTGKDKNGIKEYLAEVYNAWLTREYKP